MAIKDELKREEYLNSGNTTPDRNVTSPNPINSNANAQYRNALVNAKNNTNNQQDYYKMLKDESYKALLSAQIQASAARDQAMKYSQNQLKASGYGTQGLSESSGLGLQNQYRQSLINAQNQYNSEISNINLSEAQDNQAQGQTQFENLSNFMSQATTPQQLDSIIKNYGLSVDGNGRINFANSGLDANSQRQLQTLYSLYNANLNDIYNQEVEESLFAGKEADITSNKLYATNGNGKGKLASFGNQLKALQSFAATNDVEGKVFRITQQNGYGKASGYATYLVYRNGGWYYAPNNMSLDKVEYEVKGNKVTKIK